MPAADYIPNSDTAFCGLIGHVNTTLPQFFSALSITAAAPQVITLGADAGGFTYLCDRQVKLQQAAQAATKERNRARYGDSENPHVATDFSWPTQLPTVPSPVLPGIEKRFRDMVQWLRNLPGYDAAIGEALHLIGDEITLPDPADLRPTIKLKINGGRVEVLWPWGNARKIAHALHIVKDSGQGESYLATDTQPDYIDTTPLPASPAKWKYNAIWLRDGGMIGKWSGWQEIMVGM